MFLGLQRTTVPRASMANKNEWHRFECGEGGHFHPFEYFQPGEPNMYWPDEEDREPAGIFENFPCVGLHWKGAVSSQWFDMSCGLSGGCICESNCSSALATRCPAPIALTPSNCSQAWCVGALENDIHGKPVPFCRSSLTPQTVRVQSRPPPLAQEN